MSTKLPDGFEISADTARIDREQVHAWLSQEAYWALGRPRETQDAAIEGSRNYGVYKDGRQVAYARVVTDAVTFAWLCDVFVDTSVRGQGVGVALVEAICADLGKPSIKRIMLRTGDAHELYRKFGFKQITSPERWMSLELQTGDRTEQT
ncbi:GNAT superfamily N-acetyltransferase [Arthrobacter pigmenti]|uniref:GNAT superfamily N-acetyltransferase n=1 Tax=Arthrobacter pigmenti TaxID=271432 RepID=A0A846RM02_9MICC|nr:GNAT superfamily N-acetyltransferase [Arthrobacter pigmenti]